MDGLQIQKVYVFILKAHLLQMLLTVPPDLFLLEMENVFEKILHLSLLLFQNVKVEKHRTVLEIVFLLIQQIHHLQLNNVKLDMKLMEMEDVC